jgi:small subunit ribosomal protein S16
MVVIRLARTGSKKNPFYHVVVADKRSPRDGNHIERLGFYNPVAKGKAPTLRLDLPRIEYWLNNGAQASDTVKSIVKLYRNQVENPAVDTAVAA